MIPGLFFGDDMVVTGQGERDLKELLKMVGKCGREWKMQFNSSKSRVVNIGKKSSKEKKMAGGGVTDEGRRCLLFGDKRAGRINILRNLFLRNTGYVRNTCGECN